MFDCLEDAERYIVDEGIEQIDLKFCDLWGRWHHVTISASRFGDELMANGIGFDGSSVGFKGISSGDMVMVPDLQTAFPDPFWEMPTLSFICTTLEADTRKLYPFDPRSIVQRSEMWLKETGIADASLWGPEFEFYVFDAVTYENGMNTAGYRIESDEGGWRNHQMGSAYSAPVHGGYHAIPPRDHLHNLRSRICRRLDGAGVPVKYHHHEVGGPGQCEIETPLLPPTQAADACMIVKYMARMTALEDGMTVTFMPKPLFGEAGSGMHFHQRLEVGGRNLFYAADAYASLSDEARWYIGGLLEHGAAVLAFTNPSTNSYRRLVPGFEAPVSAIFSAGNRSAAVRIPTYANKPDTARIEFRPPDATANPYLSIAVQLLAGLDGIRRKLDPSDLGFGPVDEDIFTWSEERRRTIKALPASLTEALGALERDSDFLVESGVFSPQLIERWITKKRDEAREVAIRTHPYEVELYYDL
ncbi:MAG: type I glutamate--ammonia ligase [Acidobacteriota bacterium]|nr:type I glutamate--ammonia ligase [Acidobacteriota bacterium]